MVEGEISFGRFRLNLARRELRRDNTPIRLGRRAFDILCVLASSGGAVVSKDELMARVWAGIVVEENNLQVHISALRKALEEDGNGESWIVTVPGRGYRLLLPREPAAAPDPAPGQSLPAPDKPSIAVLPFINLSGDPEQEYFADGMVEEIITTLSHIRWLFVIARNSTFAYKGQAVDVKRIGGELGVRYVLEGSVRKAGNRVRITGQLIDAETGAHLWADRFDGSLEDVFDLQEKVAASVAGIIEPELQTAEAARSARRPTADLTAYDLFLRAHATYWASARQIPEALGLAERAIDRDPHYGLALAWAALCCHRLLIDGRSKDRDRDHQKGIDYAHRALQAARDDPGVLAVAAMVLAYFGEDLGAMTALVDRALALNPSFALGWLFSGQIRRWAGELDRAIAHGETALRLNPRGHIHWPLYLIGSALASTRRFEEAIPKLLLAIENDESAAAPYRWLVACYAHMGRLKEARATLERLRTISSIVIPDTSNLRNAEQRELFLSGLRLATGEEHGVIAAPPRVEAPPIQRGQAEHRQLTVLSCELVGPARGADGAGLEDLRGVVRAFQRCVDETASRQSGFIARHFGNNVLVLFGYPEAHEHDAERAIRTSLELCKAVRALREDMPMQCRVGIATGMVIVGDPVAVGELREIEIVGDPPDQAAWLAASAQPDAVAIDPATRRLIGNLFDCRDLGAIETSRGTEPRRRWQVLEERVVGSRFEALHGWALSPLVGRDEEIDLLLRRWTRAKVGNGQVVAISGEPGIGKSRITAALEMRLQAEPFLRLRYFCSPYHQESALFPIVDQLGHAAGFAGDDLPAAKWEKLDALLARGAAPDEDLALIADLLSLPPSERHPLPSLSPQRKKQRTLEALIRQLEGLARHQPVVMVCEDAHWIDPTSRELLDLTVERVRSLPVLLIVTFRPEFQPPWIGQEQVSTFALNRLDRRDRTVLVGQIARGKALPNDVVAQIVDRSDGVPLFVEELTKSVMERGLLREEADRYVLEGPLTALAIPTTLHASLLARLDHLASVRHVAQIGAAIGREFSYALLRTVCRLPEDELQVALSRLVASELVSQRGSLPETVYVFKHALIRDAAHGSLLRAAKQQLHAQIAEALESHSPEITESQPELLAQHYAEAGLVEKSVPYWSKAGHRSAARSAMAEAAAQLQKGLDQLILLPDNPERQRRELEFLSALGAVLVAAKGQAAPETGHAYARARELWEQLGSPAEFVQIPFGQCRYHALRSELGQAQCLSEDLLRLSRQRNDAAGLVLGHYSSGLTLLLAGRFSQSQPHLEEALALYDPILHRALGRQVGVDPEVVSKAWLSIVLLCLGYPDQALVSSSAAIADARSLTHPPSLASALAIGAGLLALVGDDAIFGERADELVAITTEQGFPAWHAQGTIYRGYAKIKNRDVADGLSLLRSGLSAYRATGLETWMPHLIALLATAYRLIGQLEQGLTLLDDALQIVESVGERWLDAELKRHKGQLLLRQGESDAAEELYRKALGIAREQEAKLWELRAAASLARLRRNQGRRAEARDLLAPVYSWFTEGFGTSDLKEAKALLDELA